MDTRGGIETLTSALPWVNPIPGSKMKPWPWCPAEP